jgi:hypothetical protein
MLVSRAAGARHCSSIVFVPVRPEKGAPVKAHRLLIAVVLLSLAGCLLAVGCGGGTDEPTGSTEPGATPTTASGATAPGSADNALLGRWYNEVTNETLEFKADGTVTGTFADSRGMIVNYTTNGNQLTTSVAGLVLVTQTYSIEGDTLILIDSATGMSGTLQRVE